MTGGEIFLSGGGGIGPEFDDFLRASMREGARRLLVLVAGENAKQVTANVLGYRDAFRVRGVPISESLSCAISREQPMTRARIRELDPTGIFVAGGLTPLYWEALCRDPSWSEHIREQGLPYAGFSAGAAIASRGALLGGWQVERGGRRVDVVSENVGEDLGLVEVRPGLDLVPFSVDAHAGQWGTVTRALHAVDRELVEECVAIDEHTLVRVATGCGLESARVDGVGVAYCVRRGSSGLRVELLDPPAR